MGDLILGAILGALALCALISGAHSVGLLHIGLGREPSMQAILPVAAVAERAYPRLGCSIAVDEKDELSGNVRPGVRLFTTVENEGDIVVRSLNGYWRVVTPDTYKHPRVKISRAVLAPHDKYLESYLIDDGIDMNGGGLPFDVLVEFDYMAQTDFESRHYSSRHRYDRKNHRMVKMSEG